MATLEEKLDAYNRRAWTVAGAGTGPIAEDPTQTQRRGQSLAISKLQDAQVAADEALRAGKYKLWLDSQQKMNDKLVSAMASVQASSNSAKAKFLSTKLTELGKINADMLKRGDKTKEAFAAASKLVKQFGLGNPGVALEGRGNQSFLQGLGRTVMEEFTTDAAGQRNLMSFLQIVGEQLEVPATPEEVKNAILASHPGDHSALRTRFKAAEAAQTRLHNDQNRMRGISNEYLKATRDPSFAGAGYFKRIMGSGANPAAGAGRNPDALQGLYDENVPAGSRSHEFEIAERGRQLGGDLGQLAEDIYRDPEFIEMAERMNLKPGERLGFLVALNKGPKATERYISKRLGRGREEGARGAVEAATVDPSIQDRATSEQDLGRLRAEALEYPGKDPRAQKWWDKSEAVDEGPDPATEMVGEKLFRDLKKLKTEFGSYGGIPDDWFNIMRGRIGEELHKANNTEGMDENTIRRLEGVLGIMDKEIDKRKLGFIPKDKKSMPQRLDERRAESRLDAPNVSREGQAILEGLRSKGAAPDVMPEDRDAYLERREGLGYHPDDWHGNRPDLSRKAAALMGDVEERDIQREGAAAWGDLPAPAPVSRPDYGQWTGGAGPHMTPGESPIQRVTRLARERALLNALGGD